MSSNAFYVSVPSVNVIITQVSFASQNPSQLQNQNTAIGKFMFSDSTDKDAFYRLRVSEPYTLFDGNTIYNNNILFFDYQVVGNCSNSGPVGAAMTHTVNANSVTNDFSAQQTHFYAKYQPGKSFLSMFSFLFGNVTSGISRRVGFYDTDSTNNYNPQNGIVLEQNINGVSWTIYQGSPGNTIQQVYQSNWNVDTFNGNGPSGVTLDFTKNSLGFVDMEWLGVGRVRCGFFVNGVPLVAHVFNNSTQTLPYINNPYLPIRYEIRKTDNSQANGSMKAICCSIISEAGYNPIGVNITYPSDDVKIADNLSQSIIAVRLNSSCPRATLYPISVEIITNLAGTTTAYFTIYLWRVNIVVGGFTSITSTPSIAEYNKNDLRTTYNNPLNGTLITLYKSSVSSTNKITLSDLPNSLLYAQSSINPSYRDILIVEIDTTGVGSSKTYKALLTWKELY